MRTAWDEDGGRGQSDRGRLGEVSEAEVTGIPAVLDEGW